MDAGDWRSGYRTGGHLQSLPDVEGPQMTSPFLWREDKRPSIVLSSKGFAYQGRQGQAQSQDLRYRQLPAWAHGLPNVVELPSSVKINKARVVARQAITERARRAKA